MGLQFQTFGVDTRCIIPASQLCQRTVDGTDGLRPVHGGTFHHDLGAGEGHNSCEPCIANGGREADNSHIMGDHLVHFDPTGGKAQPFRHCPVYPVFRIDLINLIFFKIQLIGILQEDGQSAAVQPTGMDLTLFQSFQGLVHQGIQFPPVLVIKDDIEIGFDDTVVGTEIIDLADPFIFDLNSGLQLFLGDEAALIGLLEIPQLPVLCFKVTVIKDGSLQLYDINAKISGHAPEYPSETRLNRIVPAMLREETEFHGIDLDHRTHVIFCIFDKIILDPGKWDKILDLLVAGVCGLSGGFFLLLFRASFRTSHPDRILLFLCCGLAL